jgi:hypothetical protein
MAKVQGPQPEYGAAKQARRGVILLGLPYEQITFMREEATRCDSRPSLIAEVLLREAIERRSVNGV